MANTSLTLHGIDDTDPANTVDITLSAADNKWSKTEPKGANNIFQTKSGKWMRSVTTTTLFANDAITKVGQLQPLDPAGAEKNDKGKGKSFEQPVTFGWTVTSVTP